MSSNKVELIEIILLPIIFIGVFIYLGQSYNILNQEKNLIENNLLKPDSAHLSSTQSVGTTVGKSSNNKEVEVLTTALGILSSVLVILFLVLLRTGAKSDELKDKIDNALSVYNEKYFVESVTDIFKEVDNLVKNRTGRYPLHIEMLAFTLNQITPKFTQWKDANKLKNVTMRLQYLDPNFIAQCNDIDNDWTERVNANKAKLESFINRHENEWVSDKDNVSIKINSYHHLPAVHGFVINDTYYISFATFDRYSKHINESEHATYIKIPPDDFSRLAVYMRYVFNHWITKASGEKSTDVNFDDKLDMLA